MPWRASIGRPSNAVLTGTSARTALIPMIGTIKVKGPQSPSLPRRRIRGEEPDRNTNQDWQNNQRKPLRPRAHLAKMQSRDQHSDPKQVIDKLNCSHHRHILAMQLALVNDFDHHECNGRAPRPKHNAHQESGSLPKAEQLADSNEFLFRPKSALSISRAAIC